jgi:hypothetical protein
MYSCVCVFLKRFFSPFFKIMILRICKDLERDGCGLFEGTILERLKKNHEISVIISSSRTEMQIGCMPNMSLVCYTASTC